MQVNLDSVIIKTDCLIGLLANKCTGTLCKYDVLYDLVRKMRACMTVIVQLKDHDILIVPVNLLYRCMITDLFTALLVMIASEEEFVKVMRIMDIAHTKSVIAAAKAQRELYVSVYPEREDEINSRFQKGQSEKYNFYADCLQLSDGNEWKAARMESVTIYGVAFDGTMEKLKDILLANEETHNLASLYCHYRIFSQSEHYSFKGRCLIYDSLDDDIYNFTLGTVSLGIRLLSEKFETMTSNNSSN